MQLATKSEGELAERIDPAMRCDELFNFIERKSHEYLNVIVINFLRVKT